MNAANERAGDGEKRKCEHTQGNIKANLFIHHARFVLVFMYTHHFIFIVPNSREEEVFANAV